MGQVHVHQDAPVVDALVHGVELPLPGGDGEPAEVAVYVAFHVHVPDAVGLEGLPLLGEVLGEVAVAFLEDPVGLLVLGGAEELDEGLAFGHLLLLQAQRCAGLLQAHGEPAAGCLDHRAVPAVRGEEGALLAGAGLPQVDGQAHPFEGGVVGDLDDLLVEEVVDEPLRDGLALCKVDAHHGTVIHGVGQQEDLEGLVHGVAVESALRYGLRGVCFEVYV